MKHANYWHSLGVGIIKNTDVLIIGGGIAGLYVLYQLLKAGVQAILVEENVIGFRSSGRCSGQVSIRPVIQDSNKDLNQFLESNLQYLGKLRNQDIDYNKCGELHLFTEQNGYSDDLKVDAQSIIPNTQTKEAVFLPQGITLNPMKLIYHICDSILSKIINPAPVDQIIPSGPKGFNVLIKGRGIISAKRIIHCTNYIEGYTSCFRDQILITDILSQTTLRKIPNFSYFIDHHKAYMRLHDARLLFGGLRSYMRGNQDGIMYDGEISRALYKKQRDFLQRIFPFLNTKISRVWSSVMCNTKDELPLIGELKPNEFVFAGFNQHGLSYIPLGSLIIRDLIVDGKTNIIGAKLFDLQRFNNV